MITIPPCLKFTNFRATIRQTKVVLKSIRIMGIEFTINKTVPEFNKGAEKCDLNWSDSFVEFENFSPGPSQNCLETGAS
jgi:hypothetical protein